MKNFLNRRRFIYSSSILLGGFAVHSSMPLLNSKKYFSLSLLVHPLSNQPVNVGTAATIYLAPNQGSIRKCFQQNGICVMGQSPVSDLNSDLTMQRLYELEKQTYQLLIELGSTHIPKVFSFNDTAREIKMEYCGYDCLTDAYNKAFKQTPDNSLIIEKRVHDLISMLNEYKQIGIFKMNIALSNLFQSPNGLVGIDFKEVAPRTNQTLEIQIEWLFHYMTKWIGVSGVYRLADSFDDFPRSAVEPAFVRQENIFAAKFPEHYSLYRTKFG